MTNSADDPFEVWWKDHALAGVTGCYKDASRLAWNAALERARQSFDDGRYFNADIVIDELLSVKGGK